MVSLSREARRRTRWRDSTRPSAIPRLYGTAGQAGNPRHRQHWYVGSISSTVAAVSNQGSTTISGANTAIQGPNGGTFGTTITDGSALNNVYVGLASGAGLVQISNATTGSLNNSTADGMRVTNGTNTVVRRRQSHHGGGRFECLRRPLAMWGSVQAALAILPVCSLPTALPPQVQGSSWPTQRAMISAGGNSDP